MNDAVCLCTRRLDLAADQIGLSAGSVLQFLTVAEQNLFTRRKRLPHPAAGDETGQGREQTTANGGAAGER